MKKIKIINFKSSDLDTNFSQITEINIKNNPFNEGAFGKIYNCLSINGDKDLGETQAIKIFDTIDQFLEISFKTIQSLQDKIITYNQTAKINGKKTIQEIDALKALPQFSFEGTISGKTIFGYSANFLDSMDYFLFDDIFNEKEETKRKEFKNLYYSKDISVLMDYALSLSEGMCVLQNDLNFIHADLNPKNIFVHKNKAQSIIIDYESGAVTDSVQKEALVFGKLGECLPPEINQQLINRKPNERIKVKSSSDDWALAVTIHYLLFPAHPAFFLVDGSTQTIKEYLTNSPQFPDVDKSKHFFRKAYEKNYEKYKIYFESWHEDIKKAFVQTISKGWLNPMERLTPFQWKNAFEKATGRKIKNNPMQQQNTSNQDAEIRKLKNDLKILQTENQNLQTQIILQAEAYNHELKLAKTIIERLDNTKKSDANKINQLTTEIQSTKNIIVEKEKKIKEFEGEISTLKSQLTIKDTFLEKLKKKSNIFLLLIVSAIVFCIFSYSTNFYNFGNIAKTEEKKQDTQESKSEEKREGEKKEETEEETLIKKQLHNDSLMIEKIKGILLTKNLTIENKNNLENCLTVTEDNIIELSNYSKLGGEKRKMGIMQKQHDSIIVYLKNNFPTN